MLILVNFFLCQERIYNSEILIDSDLSYRVNSCTNCPQSIRPVCTALLTAILAAPTAAVLAAVPPAQKVNISSASHPIHHIVFHTPHLISHFEKLS